MKIDKIVIKNLFSFFISFFILFLLIKKINLVNLTEAFSKSNLILIFIAAVLSVGINIFFGAFKFKRILSDLGSFLSYKEALFVRSGYLPFKVILPLKSFEILKIIYLQKSGKISFNRGLSSIILERALNLFILGIVFLIGLLFFPVVIPKWLIFFIFIFIFGFLFSKKISDIIINIAGKINYKLKDLISSVLSGFREIDLKERTVLIFYSFIYQFSEFINTYILFKAQGISVPFSILLVFIPLVIVITNLPFTIMGLGTREALLVFLFSSYGKTNSLLSAGLLISFIEHILPVIVGLFFLRKVIK